MRILFLFTLILTILTAKAQTSNSLGNPLFEIELQNLDLVSFDTKDQIFASKRSGDIYQYNSEGKQLNIFSPSKQGKLQQLEAAWTVNIFSFSADLQEYRILDRFLNPLAEKGFTTSEVNLAKASTFGNNNIIWVWDESDLSLKSIDYLRNLIIQSQPLSLILPAENLEVLEIREFKNRLFMNVAHSGIYIFDNQSNLIQKLSVDSDARMCFYKEHLFWIKDQQLMAISLETQETKNLAQLKFPNKSYLQIGQEKLLIVSKEKIQILAIPDWLKNIN